jgi:predicted pyridoxine 5'-phosphate oxidase superfamily flavin-nucleotide-binding protein
MKINEAVRIDIQNSVLCWLATVDEKGVPNVTPKEIFARARSPVSDSAWDSRLT